MAICFIIPPHILSEIRKNGSESQKAWAEDSIKISDQIRRKRLAFKFSKTDETTMQKPFGRLRASRIIYTADNSTDLPGTTLRTEGQGPTHDTAADQAYFGTGATFDLYANTYQRNSIDNNGMHIISTVHYSQQYDNAFWDGEQMVYGD